MTRLDVLPSFLRNMKQNMDQTDQEKEWTEKQKKLHEGKGGAGDEDEDYDIEFAQIAASNMAPEELEALKAQLKQQMQGEKEAAAKAAAKAAAQEDGEEDEDAAASKSFFRADETIEREKLESGAGKMAFKAAGQRKTATTGKDKTGRRSRSRSPPRKLPPATQKKTLLSFDDDSEDSD